MSQSMTIRIPDDLRKELDKISRAEGVPVSDIVRASLKKYVVLYEFEKLRAQTIPYAEARGIYTDEDVFKLIS